MINEESKNESSTEVSKPQERGVANFGGLQFNTLADMKAWGSEIVRQGFTPLKTGEAVVAAIMMGKELGLEPMVSVNNIYPINGKATLGIHIITSLLLKAGVVTVITKDYEACVPFVMKGDDDKPYMTEVEVDGVKKQKPILLRIGFADEDARPHEVKSKSVIDWRTSVKMTRQIKRPDGSYTEITVEQSYGIADAQTADLTKKDNWKNHPKQMVRTRAITLAARLIASDILNGVYETSEMLDVANIPYVVTEEGKVTIIESNTNMSTNGVSNISETEEVVIVSDEPKKDDTTKRE